jgi:hypothetical protein
MPFDRVPLRALLLLALRGVTVLVVASTAVPLASGLAGAADLDIVPADPDRIVLDVFSDSHCPFLCGEAPPRCPAPPCPDDIACCDTFRAIIQNQAMRSVAQDFTFDNGDVGITSRSVVEPWAIDRFFGYWNQVAGAKGLGVGNHEADAGNVGGELFWPDPTNHYAPMNWWEPIYGCDSTMTGPECRRWYSVHVGDPPRVAFLAISNNSDTADDDQHYVWCDTPNDGLNHAASAQRQWLNDQIDALPPTVEVVFFAGHRTYYGVENFCCRPNILYSGDWSPADPETLRTGAVSFLRDLESIYDRQPNVRRVFMLSGDQHCFSETAPIRLDQRDDERGVVYVTLGISGGWIGRGTGFPRLDKIPPNTLVHAFQDRWGSTRFEIGTDRVHMFVHEAYSDSLIHESQWPLTPEPLAAPLPAEDPPGAKLLAWPNPSPDGRFRVAFTPPAALRNVPAARIEVYAVDGRRVKTLAPDTWTRGTWQASWDGTDDAGRPVGSGAFFVRATHGPGTLATAKVTVTR